MASEEKIVNKIIPVGTIVEIANYLEDQREEYARKFEIDSQKNQNLKFSEQSWEYKGDKPKIEYTIKFKDGREITEPDYNWFVGMLNNINVIDKITIYSYISYSSNLDNNGRSEFYHLSTWIHFWEDSVTLRVDGKNLEEQVYRVHSYLRGTLENNEERYNKTVKNRKSRIQSLCLSIGFVLSYIVYLVLIGNKANLPEFLTNYMNNKFIIVFGQWFVAAILGNMLGLPIMLALYRNILPKAKYSHYSSSSHKSVYVDNIEDYVSHDEVQIGKFANNARNRELIEKIFKITNKIVLVQLAVSILLFFILK